MASPFALAVRLSAQGHSTWKEWAAALAGELKTAADRGHQTMVRATTNTGWRRSNVFVTAKALSNPRELRARNEAWADAYRNTPHGKPVAL